MDLGKAALVISITLLVVILVNVGIYYSVMRKNKSGPNSTVGQIELLRRATKRARDPWEEENNRLAELSRLVDGLRNTRPPEGD